MINRFHALQMQRALTLAEKGRGRVNPNPCVGCVIVKNGKVVGEGYHSFFGGPHAEINALNQAGDQADGGTLYLTLEPCAHWGKTPPCAPRIIKAGVRQVFIATEDPNPIVKGRGIKMLKRAGINVTTGVERVRAHLLNRSYFLWKTKNRPYVILKTAMTLDGKIASSKGNSKWISNSLSRRLVHELRAQSDAILIGRTTAERDNPFLTSHGSGRNPLRVVLDPRLKTSPRSNLITNKQAGSLIITSSHAPRNRLKLLQKKGVDTLIAPLISGKFNLIWILKELSKRNISQLIIEGGGETSWHFIHKGLVDEMYLFIAPLLLGGKDATTPIGGKGYETIKKARPVKVNNIEKIGTDFLIHCFPISRSKIGKRT